MLDHRIAILQTGRVPNYPSLDREVQHSNKRDTTGGGSSVLTCSLPKNEQALLLVQTFVRVVPLGK